MNSTDKLRQVVDFLNERELRCTYGAVAAYIGVLPRSIGQMLGDHNPRNSWVVSASDHLPTEYQEENYHSALLNKSKALTITTSKTLARVMDNPW